MSEESQKKIADFLGEEFGRTESRQCVLVQLVYAPRGTRGDPVHTYDREEVPERFDRVASAIEGMAQEITRRANDHAEGLGPGRHRYVVRAEQHSGRKNYTSIVVHVEQGVEDLEGGDGETPDAQGLIAMLMRHMEGKERTMMTMFQASLGTMSRLVQESAEDNRRLRRDRDLHLNELEEARSRQAERDLAGLRQINADKRREDALKKIMELVPVVGARLLGGGQPGGGAGEGPGGETPLSILANGLADSLSQEQMMKIFGILSTNQKIVLGELIMAAKNAKKEAPSDGAADPAAAAG